MTSVVPGRQPRLVICDAHRMVAEGFRQLLAARYSVAAVVADAAALVAELSRGTTDLVMLDLSLPDLEGLELLERLRRIERCPKILVVTAYRDRTLAEACLRSGADGYVPKAASAEELLEAVARVLAGERYLSPLLPKTSHDVGRAALHPGLWRLTEREQAVFVLMGEGLRNFEIASRMGLSRPTVGYHLTRIMRSLGFASVAALRRYAILLDGSEITRPAQGPKPERLSRQSGGGGGRGR